MSVCYCCVTNERGNFSINPQPFTSTLQAVTHSLTHFTLLLPPSIITSFDTAKQVQDCVQPAAGAGAKEPKSLKWSTVVRLASKRGFPVFQSFTKHIHLATFAEPPPATHLVVLHSFTDEWGWRMSWNKFYTIFLLLNNNSSFVLSTFSSRYT